MPPVCGVPRADETAGRSESHREGAGPYLASQQATSSHKATLRASDTLEAIKRETTSASCRPLVSQRSQWVKRYLLAGQRSWTVCRRRHPASTNSGCCPGNHRAVPGATTPNSARNVAAGSDRAWSHWCSAALRLASHPFGSGAAGRIPSITNIPLRTLSSGTTSASNSGQVRRPRRTASSSV
jgi:hypothetical protein